MTGVIIGRFQVPQLHEGHKALIDYVYKTMGHVTILVGVAPFRFTKRNPLPPGAVRASVIEFLKARKYKYTVLGLLDKPTDAEWTQQVDTLIDSVTAGDTTAIIFTDRDGFTPHYHGKYKVAEVDLQIKKSGTEVRQTLAPRHDSVAFREGMVYAIESQYELARVCVDALILNTSGHYLLVKKHGETAYRFPGGFVDPDDGSLEHTVRREVAEETANVNIYEDPSYLFSIKVNDWRGSLKTAVFLCYASGGFNGNLNDNDEIAAQCWFAKNSVAGILVPEHRAIWEKHLHG